MQSVSDETSEIPFDISSQCYLSFACSLCCVAPGSHSNLFATMSQSTLRNANSNSTRRETTFETFTWFSSHTREYIQLASFILFFRHSRAESRAEQIFAYEIINFSLIFAAAAFFLSWRCCDASRGRPHIFVFGGEEIIQLSHSIIGSYNSCKSFGW